MQSARDRAFGEWVYSQIADNVTVDKEGWAFDLIQRVADRVQVQDPKEEHLVPVVTWHEEPTAFVVPGRFAYFSRTLLQQPMGEDAVAFVFAHELAHVRLGHLDRFAPYLEWLENVPGAAVISTVLSLGDRVLFSAEHESAADGWAIDRCLEVGYDGERALELFRVMEAYALDHRDQEIVFGPPGEDAPPPGSAPESVPHQPRGPWDGLTTLLEKAMAWKWRARRGYPSLRARRAALVRRMKRPARGADRR